MSKPKRALTWVAVNAAMAAMAWYGAVQEVEWAANVFRFIFWLHAAAAVILLLGSKEDENVRKALAGGPPVPAGVDVLYDLSLGALLAASGWLGYAFGIVVIGFIQRSVYAAAARVSADATIREQDGTANQSGGER